MMTIRQRYAYKSSIGGSHVSESFCCPGIVLELEVQETLGEKECNDELFQCKEHSRHQEEEVRIIRIESRDSK
jgi:hypothetical protein